MLLASLTTGHKLALGLIAGAFMVFALASAMLIPRYKPDFPGERGLRSFLLIAAGLFVATLLAVEFFAKEAPEAAEGETPTEVTSTAPTTTGSAEPAAADVAQGEGLYRSLGCVGCHSLDGAAGTGPTFQGLYDAQVELTGGKTVAADDAYLEQSIKDPDADIVSGYSPGLMSSVIKKGSVPEPDVKALVAFIEAQK